MMLYTFHRFDGVYSLWFTDDDEARKRAHPEFGCLKVVNEDTQEHVWQIQDELLREPDLWKARQ